MSLEKLQEIKNKKERLVVGLMSGTSLDGVDTALMQIQGCGLTTRVTPVAFRTFPYENEIRKAILSCCENTADTEAVCRLNFTIGEIFAEAVIQICKDSKIPLENLDLVGSHGQTIYHIPGHSTLQIGEAAVIAERTGAITVADFRVRDMAAGGQGAPLVPYTEYLLYRHRQKTRILQNIGGIGNATIIPAASDISEVYAFDTGPGNMMIDCCTALMTAGKETYDCEGFYASLGAVSKDMLDELMSHPFINSIPPKTTGREAFGEKYTIYMIEKYRAVGLSFHDILATLTMFTAKSISSSYRSFIFSNHTVDEIIIGGGGSHNKTLMSMLRTELDGIPVVCQEELGFSSDAKEAIAFGILANEAINGCTNNLPRATGAAKPVIMGKISF